MSSNRGLNEHLSGRHRSHTDRADRSLSPLFDDMKLAHSPGASAFAGNITVLLRGLSNVSHELSVEDAVHIVYDRYWAVWTSVSTQTPFYLTV